MSSEYLIDTHRRVVISRGTGTFSHADFLAHMEALCPDPRFNPEFNHVVDGRHFKRFDMTPAQLMDMGRQSIFAPTSRLAFIVSSDLHFGLGRAFATHREMQRGQATQVFRDMREALAWLELPPDYDPNNLGEPTRVEKAA